MDEAIAKKRLIVAEAPKSALLVGLCNARKSKLPYGTRAAQSGFAFSTPGPWPPNSHR
jgi:hypothetical protein